jgi:GT2 family glycosyltransferase
VTGQPDVSIVVPTFNREDRLRRVIDALARQVVPVCLEVVVVSDGSTDGTHDYLAALHVPEIKVVVVEQPNSGPAAARNAGIQHASGDLVVFVDDDVVATPGLIAAHMAVHARLGDRAVVIGPMVDPPDHQMSPWVRWEQAMLGKQYCAMATGKYRATARQFYTGNASIRREHLVAAGGFDTRFRRAEDVELALRLDDAGLEFEFAPDAIGHHYAERSYQAWLKNAFDYGRNDVIFGRDMGHLRLLVFTARKHRSHHVFVRAAIALCAERPRIARAFVAAVSPLAVAASRLRCERVASALLSVVYGVEYYRGVLDEAGGADEFRALVSAALAGDIGSDSR